MLLYTKLAAPKIPKRRSRAGCAFCKEKKKKCDEEHPQCGRCVEHGIECVYEPVKRRQRRKRDSVFSRDESADPSKLVNEADDNKSTVTATISQSSGVPTAQIISRKFSEDSHASSIEDYGTWSQDSAAHLIDDLYDTSVISPLESAFDAGPLLGFPGPDALLTLSPEDSRTRRCNEDYEKDADEEILRLHSPQSQHALVTVAKRPRQPDLAMIAPCPTGSPLLEFCMPAFSEFSTQTNRRALVSHFCNVLSHLIVFREESGNPFQQLVLPLTQKSHPVMNAIYALASAHLEYRGVENEEKSLYFHNQAIQGLARMIERDDQVNRNELLAAIMLLVYYEVLVQKGRSNIVEGHLKGALTIMCSNPETSDPTAVFLERAFRFYDVIAALSFGKAPLSTAPAAGCLLPFPPLGAPAASPLTGVDTLLGMATTLWPVIHRLSNLLPLKSELDAAVRTRQVNKAAVLREELQTTVAAIEAALQLWTPCLPPNCAIDTNDPTRVLGIPSPPTSPSDPGEDDENAAASNPASGDGEQRPQIHSILNNAMAYRHSALVYLYRTICAHPRRHPLVQAHAHLSLTHCVATVAHKGPMGALLWPLFVGACEAVAERDRALATQAFAALERRQGMMNIERAWEIVQEVWRRADLVKEEEDDENGDVGAGVGAAGVGLGGGKGGSGRSGMSCRGIPVGAEADLWRRVSQDMGVTIVFG